MQVGDDTPWGPAQTVRAIGPHGILAVSTAGHGGLYVPDHLLPVIQPRHREWAAEWSGSENWYEEDCCWAAVAKAFPTLFPNLQGEAKSLLYRLGQ